MSTPADSEDEVGLAQGGDFQFRVPDVGMSPAQFLLLPVFWGMLCSISFLATVPGEALWDEKISGAARGMVREATCGKADALARVREGGDSW